tara:strand:- start:380 stop:718 length:339 start_codon:yes stop_codon:yes gene_type:complete
MIKELKTLWQKYFGISSPKPLETKKPTLVKKKDYREKLHGLIWEIGKDMFNVRVQIELGRCPYCDTITQMMSTQIGYFRCGNCKEITKQYINGRIAYLPVDNKSVLSNEPKT